MTDHMWSGFHRCAHLKTWWSLPPDIQAVIDRGVAGSSSGRAGRSERGEPAPARGARRARMAFTAPVPEPFKNALSAVYATWKERLGARCWTLLAASTGLRTWTRLPLLALLLVRVDQVTEHANDGHDEDCEETDGQGAACGSFI